MEQTDNVRGRVAGGTEYKKMNGLTKEHIAAHGRRQQSGKDWGRGMAGADWRWVKREILGIFVIVSAVKKKENK